MRKRSRLDSSEASDAGWVGVADSLIAGLVLFLLIALVTANQLYKANIQVADFQVKLLASENENKTSNHVTTILNNEMLGVRKMYSDIADQFARATVENTKLKNIIAKLESTVEEYLAQQSKLHTQLKILSPKAADLDIIINTFNSTENKIVAKLLQIKRDLDLFSTIVKGDAADLVNRKIILDKILMLFKSNLNDIIGLLEEVKKESDTEVKIKQETYADLKDKANELLQIKELLAKRPKDSSVHRELLSIKGELKKAVIILDFSGSMAEKRDNQESRWVVAKNYINNVCEFLDMDQCALIVFSYDIKVFGKNNTSFDKKPEEPAQEIGDLELIMRGYTEQRDLSLREQESIFGLTKLTKYDLDNLRKLRLFKLRDQPNDRQLLKNTVTNLPEPFGGTNTLKALNAALEIDGVTNILLFTDGEPGVMAERLSAEENNKLKNTGIRIKPPDFKYQRDWIFKMIDRQKEAYKDAGKQFPKINAIGIGDYFDKDLSSFLRTLSEEKTGGSFQGR
jgi:hypothetical protein